MGIFSRRSEKDALQVQSAVLGTRLKAAPDGNRVAASELVKRYGFWVHRCISLNAQAAAAVPLRLFSLAGGRTVTKTAGRVHAVDTRTKAFLRGKCEVAPSASVKHAIRGITDDMTEIESHPVLDLLNDVNDWVDGYGWREGIYSDLQATGMHFTHAPLDNGGVPVEMWRLMPHITKVMPDKVEFVSHFEYGNGVDMERFEKEEVLWFRLFDPTNPWGGLGPLEAWLQTIDASFAIQAFQYEILHRFGTPDYVAINPQGWTQDQASAFRKIWKGMFGRMGRRKEAVATVGGSVTLEKLGQSNRELEFNKSAEALRNSVGQGFGVPQAILTTDDVNRANARETIAFWFKTTLWNYIQRVENVLNEQLLPMFGGRLVLVHDNPIPEDREARIAERASQLQSGYSINQVLADDGREALDDPLADEPMVGSGFSPLSGVVTAAEDGTGEEVEPEEPAEEPVAPEGVETTQETVLNGAQITAATAIVQAVADGVLPRESAIGQLEVFFNLDTEQAERIMGTVGTTFDPKPKPVPPGLAPPGQEPKPEDEKPEEEPPDPDKGLEIERVEVAAGIVKATTAGELPVEIGRGLLGRLCDLPEDQLAKLNLTPPEPEPVGPEPGKTDELERVKAVSELVRQIAAREIPVKQGKAVLALHDLTECQIAGLFPEGYEPPQPDAPEPPEPEPEVPTFTADQFSAMAKALVPPVEVIKEIEVVKHSDLLAKEIRPGTDKITAEFALAVSETLRKLARRVLARARRTLTTVTIDSLLLEADIEKWAAEIAAESRPYIRRQMVEAAEAALKKLPVQVAPPAPPAAPPAAGPQPALPPKPRKPPVSIAFNIEDQQAVAYIRDASRQVGRQATDTFRETIRESLAEGFEQGEGLPQISKRIQAIEGGDFPKWKADQIARTETGFAQGFGTEMGWMQSGVVTGKYFHMSPDACEWCQLVGKQYGTGRPAEGEATPRGAPASSVVVPLGVPFYNQDEYLELPRKDGTGMRRLSFDYRAVPDGKVHPSCRCGFLPIMRGET